MTHDTQSAQISQKQDERNIYAIMKTMCPPGYHHNGFVATHALGHMSTSRVHVFMYRYIYVYEFIYVYMYIYLCVCAYVSKIPSSTSEI